MVLACGNFVVDGISYANSETRMGFGVDVVIVGLRFVENVGGFDSFENMFEERHPWVFCR